MSNDKRLERIGNKLRNNINNVVCKDVDKINLGFVSTNLFGSSYFGNRSKSCCGKTFGTKSYKANRAYGTTS